MVKLEKLKGRNVHLLVLVLVAFFKKADFLWQQLDTYTDYMG